MELTRFLHHHDDDHDPRTPGIVLHGGRHYEAFTGIFFLGRRRHVYTRLASLSGARTGDRVLDVGCGTGYFTRAMADVVGCDGTAVGIDASADMLEHARQITRVDNCTFSEGLAESLEAADGSYDVVVTSLMIHHLPEDLRGRAIAEMFRVLRPGGRILVADFRPPTNPIASHVIGAVTGHVMQHNPVHLLEPMVREAGFVDVETGDVRPWMHYVRGVKPAT